MPIDRAYWIVLSDLRARLMLIDRAILALEAILHRGLTSTVNSDSPDLRNSVFEKH